jgi:ribosomal-protein-alanine N-acetyltransferase
MKAPYLTSERLLFKPISIDHLSDNYLNWLNDYEVIKFLESDADYNIDSLKKYILEAQQKDIYFWGIHLKENGLHIGNIKIDPINLKHGLGEYGILMGNRLVWGKGYAKEASIEIINYCFHELKLRKITLGVVEDNIAAVSLYKKIGFLIEGCYINHGFYDGRYCNILRMALFKNSFEYDRL